MTVVPTTGGVPAIPEEDYGLEDFDTSTDAVMPRLTINHPEAKFVDNLSGQEFDSLEVILLGLVKGRILWDSEVEEGDTPLCKSLNFNEGRPDEDRFPWKQSGFDKNALVVPAGTSELLLPCSACGLKEWGSAPNGKTPWCSEQHTFPLLMKVGDGGWAPALFTTQRTGIKPSKTYLTSFARTKTPLYTVTTKLSLQAQKRGTVNYAVPIFVQGEPTEQSEWPYYAQQYRQIRDFLHTPPVRDEDAEATTATPAAAPADAATAASTVTAPAAASDVDDESDIPF